MSTRKRYLILSLSYITFLMLFVIFLTFSSQGWLENIQAALTLTYSIILIAFYLGMGIATRFLSCKLSGLALSFAWAVITLALTLATFNVVYSPDDIKAINGFQPNLSLFEDVGWSYILYGFGVFFGSYILTSFVLYIIKKHKYNKIVDTVAERNGHQIKANMAMIVTIYNKKLNQFDKYLVYTNSKGKLIMSDIIIYYDKVELIVVDISRKVYAMIDEPTKISSKEFVMLQAKK